MDATQKLTVLIDELDEFVGYETQAIREGNWEYFKEVGLKKQRHLDKVAQLAVEVDLESTGLRLRLENLRNAQKANGDLIADAMSQNQERQGEVTQAQGRIAKVRSYINKQQGGRSGGLKADA